MLHLFTQSSNASFDMKSFSPKFRIGNGYDIHRLIEDRDLILGGVKLHHPENLGLDGHSDADVLSHSIICLLYTSPSPRDKRQSRMPSSA